MANPEKAVDASLYDDDSMYGAAAGYGTAGDQWLYNVQAPPSTGQAAPAVEASASSADAAAPSGPGARAAMP
ncbi:hypothetical protein H4R21_004352, partial [Coemansia helicoidea]